MPAGALVTVPVPAPDLATENAYGAGLTVCVSTADVEAVLPASPAYSAVIERAPTGSALLVQAADAPATGTVLHPAITVVPSLNATVPVGVLPVTVAVNVTDRPKVELAGPVSTVVEGPNGVVNGAGAEGALVPVAFCAVTVHK